MSGLITGAIVDWEPLLDAALASVAAGLGVTLAASTAIYGFATFSEMRREERAGAAVASAVLAVAGVLVVAAAIAVGLYVMIND